MSAQRLGVTVIPGAGWRASDVRNVAREAEAAGFDAIFTTEVNNDALATAQLMGSATTHIQIGTWIASIYLRHSYTCAKGASLIADDTGGRFVLGLGVSHQPVNDALAIDMSNAPADLHRYAIEVRNWLDGNGPGHPPSPAARTRHGADLHRDAQPGGRRASRTNRRRHHADHVVPRTSHPKRRPGRSGPRPGTAPAGTGHHAGTADIHRGRPRTPSGTPPARTWALYTFFPYFQRMWRESGFGTEADQMKKGAGPAALSDRLLDSFCLFGPVTRCQERLAAYRAAGVALPILNPPIGPDAALAVIRAFAT